MLSFPPAELAFVRTYLLAMHKTAEGGGERISNWIVLRRARTRRRRRKKREEVSTRFFFCYCCFGRCECEHVIITREGGTCECKVDVARCVEQSVDTSLLGRCYDDCTKWFCSTTTTSSRDTHQCPVGEYSKGHCHSTSELPAGHMSFPCLSIV